MNKCKNCEHRIRSLTVWDRGRIKHKYKQFFTHTRHNVGCVICAVKRCECENPEQVLK